MSDRNRKALMNHAIDLMILHFGLHPEKKHKIMVAEAIVALFGKLKTHPSSCNGIVRHILKNNERFKYIIFYVFLTFVYRIRYTIQLLAMVGSHQF